MRISQILWVINGETKAIVPIKIVEKITKETLEGEKVEFIVESVNGKKKILSEIKELYFESPEAAKQYLLDSAIQLIDEIVARAVSSAEKFSSSFHVQENKKIDIVQEDPVTEFVLLPDGTKARLRIKN